MKKVISPLFLFLFSYVFISHKVFLYSRDIDPGVIPHLDELNSEILKATVTLLEDNSFASNTPVDKTTSCDERNKVAFKEIIGLDEVVADMKEIVDFLKNPEKYERLGAYVPRGVLLVGPPGNGKTMIAKAMAHESGCNFFYASASSFVQVYAGVGAQRIRALFNKARKESDKAIIFIDELDAIGATSRFESNSDEHRQTLTQLLCELDGFENNKNIVVLAATNNASSLDKALIRSGRFDCIVTIAKPDKENRTKILEHYVHKLPCSSIEFFALEDIASKTQGFCAADLKSLVNLATLDAVRKKDSIVKRKHFDCALGKMIQMKKSIHD